MERVEGGGEGDMCNTTNNKDKLKKKRETVILFKH